MGLPLSDWYLPFLVRRELTFIRPARRLTRLTRLIPRTLDLLRMTSMATTSQSDQPSQDNSSRESHAASSLLGRRVLILVNR